jgi:hypothetical protein
MTYTDSTTMPTYERKYFINKLANEFEEKRKIIEQSKSKK